jgi:hypothetical protein
VLAETGMRAERVSPGFGTRATEDADRSEIGQRRVHDPLAVAVAGLLPKAGVPPPLQATATLAGTGQIAPSPVQQRTMSRTDRMPTVSPRSSTIR